ncbi:MAG: sigma-54-dependent Fis family transcriptional regulator [Fidelibacterota bacterium]|nr:MAG: sigma-54-dependent Fis family transcriptional regulator [Candidatus Neomarinimicrobiota bacterium]
MPVSPRVLVIDDDEALRDSSTQILTRDGFLVETAENGEYGLQLVKEQSFDIVLLDLKMPGIPGEQVLQQIRDIDPEILVIIITGHASIESAVEMLRQGAYDYVPKPFTPEDLRLVVRRALEKRSLSLENIYLREEVSRGLEQDNIIGRSPGMCAVEALIKKVGPTGTTVLITGESGTGKELVAKAIRNHSPRRAKPFITVDCGSLVETLFESELFGHVKGSFTGATTTKHGRFELANGGTIFFDEIGNISSNIQAKLLRALQEGEVTKVGSSQVIKIDVRIIAATNQDLRQAVESGHFRDDLFYRLSVVPIHLPPLRERQEDIPLLANHFLQKYSLKRKKTVTEISDSAMTALLRYSWPGNVRELENAIERAVVLTDNSIIEPDDLLYYGFSLADDNKTDSQPPMTLEEMERNLIRETLHLHGGNRSKTAQALGIDRKTLWAKLRKYAIS